ncbi:MAG: hypothetical protein ABR521_01685 [Gaiellaceae bacterium]
MERAISFTKGCDPGQEPVAQLHHRGHANRGLRVLRIEAPEPPPDDAELLLGDRVGRASHECRPRGRGRGRTRLRALGGAGRRGARGRETPQPPRYTDPPPRP